MPVSYAIVSYAKLHMYAYLKFIQTPLSFEINFYLSQKL